MTSPRFFDIHILQSLPPSNVNRDDAGSPKQAVYGGVRRARVSSQAWKRAARKYVAEHQPKEAASTRTKRLVSMVAPLVAERASVSLEDATSVTTAVVGATIKMDSKKPEETSYLLFFGRAQVARVADLVADHASELLELSDTDRAKAAKDVKLLEVLGTGHPVDVALYGRMVADLATLNVDAATQVAHAISTHPVELEFDYYTAVDDENTDEETGAGMIGTVEFNSATLYRYATVAVDQLAENLGDSGEVGPAIAQFLESFVKSIPSGHQNSFGHRTRPALVAVVGRDDQPVNLVNAFERPIDVDSQRGFESSSLERFAEFYVADVGQWGDTPSLVVASYSATDDGGDSVINAFGTSVAFDELVTRVAQAVNLTGQQ